MAIEHWETRAVTRTGLRPEAAQVPDDGEAGRVEVGTENSNLIPQVTLTIRFFKLSNQLSKAIPNKILTVLRGLEQANPIDCPYKHSY
jgi:hypothetical protein